MSKIVILFTLLFASLPLQAETIKDFIANFTLIKKSEHGRSYISLSKKSTFDISKHVANQSIAELAKHYEKIGTVKKIDSDLLSVQLEAEGAKLETIFYFSKKSVYQFSAIGPDITSEKIKKLIQENSETVTNELEKILAD